jgi:hypothetical protein
MTSKKMRQKITITEKNVPISRSVPIHAHKEKVFGMLKGTVREVRNIVDPIDEVWDADS